MAEAIRAIGDHGIIGDMETAALVASDATLDYLCWPSLDSPSLFADLLSPGNGGAFSIRPGLERPRNLQVYLPETNVLMTRWMAEDGSAEVVDLMPHPEVQGAFRMNARSVVRRICVTRGEIEFKVVCDPRFDYAREIPVASLVDGGVRFAGRDLAVRLFASVPLECGAEGATARFTLKAGGHAWFVLGEDGLRSPANDAAVQANIDATARAWRGWLARGHYQGRWREQVTRSALTLKLLTSARHGSIAAAATFSLPEATWPRCWAARWRCICCSV